MMKTLRSLAVLIFIFLAGCGGGCFGFGAPELKEFETVPMPELGEPGCEQVDLLLAAAPPFGRVLLAAKVFDPATGELRVHQEGLGVEVEYEGVEETLFLPVYFDEEWNGHYFIAPHHPNGLEGGTATLTFSDLADFVCPESYAFEILPLEPDPTALEEMIQASTALTRELARSYGYDPDELVQTDPETLPVMMVPLAYHIWMMDHPDNPNSLLRGLQEGTLPFEFTDEDLAIVGAYFRAAGAIESMQEALVELEQLDAEYGVRVPRFRGQQFVVDGRDVGERQQALCSGFSDLVEVEISSAEELSYYMRKADAAARTAKHMESVATLVGLVGTIPTGPVALASKVTSLILLVDKVLRSAHINLLPNYLFDPDVREWEYLFFEDSDEPGVWQRYSVSAGAPGWDASGEIADALMEAVLEVVDFPGIPSTVLGGVMDSIKIPPSYMEEFAGNVMDFAAGSPILDRVLPTFSGTNLCVFEAGPWEKIPIHNPNQLEVTYLQTIANRAGPGGTPGCYPRSPAGENQQYYEPRAVGAGVVRVSASTAFFPPATNRVPSRWEGAVDVLPITVELTPHRRAAMPGEVVEVERKVYNAHWTRGEWSILTEGAEFVETPGENTEKVQVRLPEDGSKFPVFVRFESKSDTGLRHEQCQPPPRYAYAIFTNDEALHISPKFRCVGEDEELVLEAHATSRAADPEVRWSASSGSISGDGDGAVFRPSERGEVTITAELVGSDKKDSARVRVGPCECFYDVSMSGAYGGSYGDFGKMRAAVTDGRLVIRAPTGDDRFVITTDYVVPGQPGVYPGGLSSFQTPGFFGPFSSTSVVPGEGSIVSITRWTEDNYIQGTYWGIAEVGISSGLDGGTAFMMPPTFVEVHFMTYVGNALGMLLSGCKE